MDRPSSKNNANRYHKQREAQLSSAMATNKTFSLSSLYPLRGSDLFALLRRDFDMASSLAEAACNVADILLNQMSSFTKLQHSTDPLVQLAGNCTPVCETSPTICNVRGKLPDDLVGAYVRNGPNATYMNPGEGFHLFDGDGMLHAVKMKDGKAVYCCRYVKTARFKQEEAAGRPLFPKLFGGSGEPFTFARTIILAVRVALGLVDISKGCGLSNTSVSFFRGQVLSMSEDDLPYIIQITESGDLVTVGQYHLPGIKYMCAHPKFNQITGEMFSFSFTPTKVLPFSVLRVSGDGLISAHIPVPLRDTPMLHDFAITGKYIVFADHQFMIRPFKCLWGGDMLVQNHDKTPGVGLLPRYSLPSDAAYKFQWLCTPACNCMHFLNAWDDGPDQVVVIATSTTSIEALTNVGGSKSTCSLMEIRLNTETGKATPRPICAGNFEFGTLNQKYLGKKSRYMYVTSGKFPDISAIVKLDLELGKNNASGRHTSVARETTVVAKRKFGDGCIGGEPFFVPQMRSEGNGKGKQDEDDGYILCYVHNMLTEVSELLVMDAQTRDLQIIASVVLPSRVPCGFHGWFISEEQLEQQYNRNSL
ncbi:hypothetical protein KP509_23G048100 [Ceratopteris richardii]|nr:hypothetical protein KP509_23G048100 [Ceratopteris richardii]